MSLIELALAKLRGSGGTVAAGTATAARPPGSGSSKPARALRGTAQEYVLKRITLDTKALRAAGYLPDVGLEPRFADHYRHIKRPLIDKALSGGADLRTILVSSALPGDGKTFTCLNLALSMARERDISVLLVDADASRAHISEVLGVRGERGLIDVLADESMDVESSIVQTDVNGLEILPAGRFVDGAHELIASARMDLIAARLTARNTRQLILFDSAPLLVSGEARALQRTVGQVVLVLRAGATPLHAALEAVAQVDGQKLQGVILNCANASAAAGYYAYSGYGDSEH